ncbi:MAG: LCP family protein [Gordonia sp. (in: high G+C Gram-positive bacteria)]
MGDRRIGDENRLTAREVVNRTVARGTHVPRWNDDETHEMEWPRSAGRHAAPSRQAEPARPAPVAADQAWSAPASAPRAVRRRAEGRSTESPRASRSRGRPIPAPHEARRRKPSRARRTALNVVRTAVVLVSVGTIGVAGLAWAETNRMLDGFTSSAALDKGPKSTGGAENILLMGLDTRKDLNGNDLPKDLLAQLHAGDGQEGGYNTNTLILVHIPADKKKITAFSIPRDDLVSMQGVDVPQAKIKEAYGRRKAMTEDQLSSQGVVDPQELESRGREAGRAETLQTVRELTGVPIDRFAEVSLAGFYDLAKALGGVTVCLNHAVSDDYSGANFRKGSQTLDAKQSLAFVRQRHGLDNGDLDRTHRQQAFMLSALGQLRQAGTFTDVDKINALIDAAQRNVVLSSGWNLLDWAQTMGTVDGQTISFTTLPVVRYDTYDGQDVNIIDPAAIRARVQQAFGVKPAHPASTTEKATTTDDTTTVPVPSSDEPAPDSGSAVTNSSSAPCVN